MAEDGRPTAAGAYAKIEAHEELCAERYRGINEKLHWLLGGVGLLFVGILGWSLVQLYTLEPLRIAAAHQTRSDVSAQVTQPQPAKP